MAVYLEFEEHGASPEPVGTGDGADPWGRGAGRPPRCFVRAVRAAGMPGGPFAAGPVTGADLAPLPPPVQRYLRFMGVPGRPRDRSLRAHMVGRFRRRADRPWMPCDAWLFATAAEPARVFGMRRRGAGAWTTRRDVYVRSRGRTYGDVLGVLPVVRDAGPKADTNQLVRWLCDAVLLAPSMLLGPATTWATGPDPASFEVAVTDRGRTVSAQVLLDARGAAQEVWTDDRHADLPGGVERVRWHMQVDGWVEVDGRSRMTGASTTWDLLCEPFRYGELTLAALEQNAAGSRPPSPVPRRRDLRP
ncbi:hypothetical protein BJF90_32310 [Pseudonocardia sp. CNS-004]|nr:hypothetical protein BJF90_32310 [Pseudonocardia sp. CNS-004]